MNATFIAPLAGVALALSIGLSPLVFTIPPTMPAVTVSAADGGVMTQSEFPCQEDEVLGYAPQFGPDHVGCIHIEELATGPNAWDAGAYVGGYN